MNNIEKWISFVWFDGSKELDGLQEEYIWGMMKQGYTSGELINEYGKDGETRGWWKRREK